MPNRSKGRGQTKCDPSGPLGRGFGWGLITHSRKNIACSRPSVSGSVRRAAGERGKNEEGQSPLTLALSP